MKTKLEMAHDYLRDIVSNWEYDDSFDPVAEAWKYADAMQAEVDKRKKEGAEEESKKRKEVRQKLINTFESNKLHCSDDWQPDWSQAPADATYWTMRQDGECLWWKGKPLFDGSCFYDAVGICHTVGYAPSFGYTGDWRNSLRKRPE